MSTLHSGEPIAERDGLTVIDCKTCGFAHLHPLPSRAELAQFYTNEFWQHTKIGTRERMDEQREWWSTTYGDWLSMALKHTPVDSLLDVGAGYGHLIDQAERMGFEARGIEPSADVDHPDIWRGTWEAWNAMMRYGCVSALWLIEHLPDPLKFLRWVRARLCDAGVLLACVPNDFSEAQALAMDGGYCLPNYWLDPTHLNYFTPATLNNLLGRAGFRVVERTTLYPMELWLLQGQDYTRDAQIGARCHTLVRMKDLGKSREERLREYGDLASVGLGREIVVVAVKE